MNGAFGSLINTGVLSAAPGAFALQTGPTAVGTLVVNSGVIDGPVAVAAGPFARFQNSGWMGISAPGAGVTHAISGVFAQTSNGTLALRVGNGVSDQLVVNGQARLAGTALATFQPGALGNNYTLLQATGGYTGTFNALATQNLPGFLSASLSYGTNNVSLFLQSSMASTPGLGGNQISVARALDTAFNAGPGLGAMPALFGLSQGQLPPALSLLAGDNASVGQSVAFAAGGQFTSLLSGRAGTRRAEELAAACKTQAATACAPPSEWGAWASGFGGGQWLNADSSTGSSASQQSIGGGAFGADYRAGPQTLVGLAVGVSGSNYSVSSTSASGQATGVHFGLYASHDFQPFYVTTALAYSRFDGNATRVIAGIGNTETEKSSAVASQLASRVEVGRVFDVGQFQGESARRHAVCRPAALPPLDAGRFRMERDPERQHGRLRAQLPAAVHGLAADVSGRPARRPDGDQRAAAQGLAAGGLGARVHDQPQRDGGLHRVAGQQLHRRRRARRQRRRAPRPGRPLRRRQPDVAVRQRQCRTVRPRAEPGRHRRRPHRLVTGGRHGQSAMKPRAL